MTLNYTIKNFHQTIIEYEKIIIRSPNFCHNLDPNLYKKLLELDKTLLSLIQNPVAFFSNSTTSSNSATSPAYDSINQLALLILSEQVLKYSSSQHNISYRNTCLNFIFNVFVLDINSPASKSTGLHEIYNNPTTFHNLKKIKLILFKNTLSIALSVVDLNTISSLNFIHSSVQIMKYYKQEELIEIGLTLTDDFLLDYYDKLQVNRDETLKWHQKKRQKLDQENLENSWGNLEENGADSAATRSRHSSRTERLPSNLQLNKFLKLGIKCPNLGIFLSQIVLSELFLKKIESDYTLEILTFWLEIIIFWIENFDRQDVVSSDLRLNFSPYQINIPGSEPEIPGETEINEINNFGEFLDEHQSKYTKWVFTQLLSNANLFKNQYLEAYRMNNLANFVSDCPVYEIFYFLVIFHTEICVKFEKQKKEKLVATVGEMGDMEDVDLKIGKGEENEFSKLEEQLNNFNKAASKISYMFMIFLENCFDHLAPLVNHKRTFNDGTFPLIPANKVDHILSQLRMLLEPCL